jgi:hypothetical protein
MSELTAEQRLALQRLEGLGWDGYAEAIELAETDARFADIACARRGIRGYQPQRVTAEHAAEDRRLSLLALEEIERAFGLMPVPGPDVVPEAGVTVTTVRSVGRVDLVAVLLTPEGATKALVGRSLAFHYPPRGEVHAAAGADFIVARRDGSGWAYETHFAGIEAATEKARAIAAGHGPWG